MALHHFAVSVSTLARPFARHGASIIADTGCYTGAVVEEKQARTAMQIVTPSGFLHAGMLSQRFASADPRRATFREPELDIDMRACEFIRPAAVLWCVIYPLLAANRGSECRLLVPDNLGVCIYLKSVGLLDAMQAGGVEVDDRGIPDQGGAQIILPLTEFKTETEVEELANNALDSLGKAGLGAANIHPLVSEVFAELALNAVQHSESPVNAYGFIQFTSSSRAGGSCALLRTAA